jgi:LuxR family maltose regulon positive regulatory protein
VNRIIDEALETYSLLILRAPELFGKSTAVAGWAASDHPYRAVLWIDAKPFPDAPGLWREILGRAAGVIPAERPGSPRALAMGAVRQLEDGSPVLEAFRAIAAALLPDIPSGVLILDNVQGHLPRGFLDALVALMRRFDGLRVIIITTRDLRLAGTGVGMVLDAGSIGPNELRLTREEVCAALAKEPPGLDPEEVFTCTGGHPALVRAAVAAYRFDPAGTDVRRAVTDFIRAGIFRSEPGIRHRSFLLRTSVAKRLTVGLATDLSEDPGAKDILTGLVERGYMRRHATPDGDLYSYEKPLRIALHEALEEQHPELVPALQRLMVAHHLSYGEPWPALEEAVRVGDLDLANAVVRDHQVELRTRHASRTRRVLESIPDEALVGRPMLALTLAMIRHGGDRDYFRTAELMDLAMASAESVSRAAPLADRASALLARTVALRADCQWKEAAKAADAAAGMFEAAGVTDRWKSRGLAVAVYIQAAATHMLATDYDRAEPLLYRALAIAIEQDMGSSVQQACGLLALTHASTGRILTAATVLSQSPEPDAGETVGTDFSSTPYRLASALVALESGDHQKAAAQMELAGPAAWTGEFWPYAMMISIAADVLTDPRRTDLDETGRALGREDLPCPSMPLRSSLLSSVSTAHLAAGNAGRAVAAVRGLDRRNAKVALVLARASLAVGEDAQAAAVLSSARLARLDERRTVQLLMLRAILHERAGRAAEAEEAAQSGLRIMKRTGLGMSLLMVPESDVYRQLAEGIPQEGQAPAVIPRSLAMARLTVREQVVLRTLAERGSAAEAAKALVVSVNTIKAQMRSIYRKLGVTTLQSALAVAELQGLLPEQ